MILEKQGFFSLQRMSGLSTMNALYLKRHRKKLFNLILQNERFQCSDKNSKEKDCWEMLKCSFNWHFFTIRSFVVNVYWYRGSSVLFLFPHNKFIFHTNTSGLCNKWKLFACNILYLYFIFNVQGIPMHSSKDTCHPNREINENVLRPLFLFFSLSHFK